MSACTQIEPDVYETPTVEGSERIGIINVGSDDRLEVSVNKKEKKKEKKRRLFMNYDLS